MPNPAPDLKFTALDLKQVDPDGTLPAAEREAAVDRMQKAHMARMTLASARKRTAGARHGA